MRVVELRLRESGNKRMLNGEEREREDGSV